jgi:uncharacterized repeat protein (TIGR03803 family)
MIKNLLRSSLSFVLLLALGHETNAWSQSYQVIYNFGGPGSGIERAPTTPIAGLVFDSHGNLFGTSESGGSILIGICLGGCGTVYELQPNGGGQWSEKSLYEFDVARDQFNGYLTAPVALDGLGNIYGVANCVQDCFFGYGGSFFKLTFSGGGWTKSVLLDGNSGFDYTGCGPFGGFGTGSQILCSIALDHGQIYGSTVIGGMQGQTCNFGCGKVFSLLQRSVTQYDYLLDYAFRNGSDGNYPQGLLAFDAAGNIYGTTGAGGAASQGTAYMLTRNQQTFGWSETLLHSFAGGTSDGANPIAGLVLDAAGNLYGTTSQGGTANLGTVFTLTPQSNGTWLETVLYSFLGGSDASTPNSSLSIDAAGNLYGTAGGGAHNQGTVFKLTHSGEQWTESILHTFTGEADGGLPYGGVTLDNAGNIFGTASTGGAYSSCRYHPSCGGVAFEITP